MRSDADRRSSLARIGERNPILEPVPSDEAFHCITCSDEGCPLTVVQVDAERGLALCEAADGERSTVEIALVDGAVPGAILLVHAGTALTLLKDAA